MAVYLVSYDLNKETRRPPIVDKVREFPWARLSESSYVIRTPLTADQVYAAFKPLIDDNDNLYVITLKKPWNGWGPKDVNDWLNTNLPN